MTATSRAARLLLAEADALLPILRATPAADFDRPTVLPGWSVRDVLAHCSAALGMAGSGSMHGFSPAENQRDVDERAGRPLADLLSELANGYAAAAAAMDAADGALDRLALGEWVHGGDVRDALGRNDGYVSAGVEDALVLLGERSVVRGAPHTEVILTGPGAERTLVLGTPGAGEPARLRTDVGTLFRLVAGRSPDPAAFALDGAAEHDLRLFT
jgi:uncharacterized protein (TIGR03083 family)